MALLAGWATSGPGSASAIGALVTGRGGEGLLRAVSIPTLFSAKLAKHLR